MVGHLITTDRAAPTGSIVLPILRSFDSVEAWNDRQVGKWADRPVRDLLLGLRRGARRTRAARQAGARIRTLAPAFVMATAGRDRFDELEAKGVLKIEGDQDLAHRFLSKLRIV